MYLKTHNYFLLSFQHFLKNLLFSGLGAIHLEAVLVPQSKFRGQNATLLCKYDLESNEELFSLKWYKEETEFYRYTPPDPLATHHQQVSPSGQSLITSRTYRGGELIFINIELGLNKLMVTIHPCYFEMMPCPSNNLRINK